MGDARTVFAASCRDPQLDADDPAHDGPLVSIVVVTRDGLHHLRRLFGGLTERTAYRDFEVVVVDNGSTDGTLQWLQDDHGFPVEVIANSENRSFSHANNQGLDVARGEIALICNNDVEPVHADWLTRLVSPLAEGGVVATGPVLVYPELDDGLGATRPAPFTVQSAGIGFELDAGRVRARNLGQGTDPLRPALRRTRTVGALTAACLAVRTGDLRTLGGFDTSYFYGSEDWDLCLRLQRHGEMRLVGRSVVYHHEFGTQDTIASEERRSYWRRNHVVFNARWGANVRRAVLLEHLVETGLLLGDLRSTLVVTPSDDPLLMALAHDMRAIGWLDHEGGGHRPTLELTTLGVSGPSRSKAGLCVAVTERGRSGAVPERADVVVGVDGHVPWSSTHIRTSVELDDGASRPGAVGDLAGRFSHAVAVTQTLPRIAVRVGDPAVGSSMDYDLPFAQSLAGAFARAGIPAQARTHDEWELSHGEPFDFVVHLRGEQPLSVEDHETNVLWIVGDGAKVTSGELAQFDLVLVASRPLAEQVASTTDRSVHVLYRAVDTTVFRPPRGDLRQAASGIVVVGDARFPCRRVPRHLLELGVGFELYGCGWEGSPEESRLAGGHPEGSELADVYATADVVVATQEGRAAERGFVDQQLFDVAAAGGFVVSEDGPGVAEVFGDLVPTYSGRDELREVLERFEHDPGQRDQLATLTMQHVRVEHSLDVRVGRLLELLGIGE